MNDAAILLEAGMSGNSVEHRQRQLLATDRRPFPRPRRAGRDSQHTVGMEWQNGNDEQGAVIYDLVPQQYASLNNDGDSPHWLPDNRRATTKESI